MLKLLAWWSECSETLKVLEELLSLLQQLFPSAAAANLLAWKA